MTREEFQSWLENGVFARDPSKRSWLDKQPNAQETLAHWYELLADLDVTDITRATYQLYVEGELFDLWANLPVVVRDRARDLAVNRQLKEADAAAEKRDH